MRRCSREIGTRGEGALSCVVFLVFLARWMVLEGDSKGCSGQVFFDSWSPLCVGNGMRLFLSFYGGCVRGKEEEEEEEQQEERAYR